MGRLTEQQAKHILFNAQTIAYPNREVPEMLKPLYTYIETVELENTRLREEAERHQIWVNDLQSGMYINCAYCGHRYGPENKVPASMADVLKEHIEKCPEHPMSKLRAELKQVKAERDAAVEDLRQSRIFNNTCAFCVDNKRETDEEWPTERCNRSDISQCWRWRGLEGRA